MTIETITDLIHEYMYDRLNESTNSNDGKEIQYIQERQFKRKWSDKSSYQRSRKNWTVRNQNTKVTDGVNATH